VCWRWGGSIIVYNCVVERWCVGAIDCVLDPTAKQASWRGGHIHYNEEPIKLADYAHIGGS
jgi:hypothetical protein